MKQVSLSGLLAVSAMMSIAGASTLSADQAVSVGTQSEENSHWEFNAGLTISQEYTDNAFLTANDRRDDFITTVFPWATLSMRTEDFQLNLDASAGIGRYSSYSSEDYNDYSLGAEARYRLGRSIFAFGGLGFDKDHESRDSPDDVNGLEPTEYREKSGFLGVGGRFDDRLYRFGISIQDLDFDDTPAAGGFTINNDDRDRQQTEIGGRVGIAKTAAGEVFVQGIYNVRDYVTGTDDQGYDRDSQGFEAAVGLTGKRGDLSGEITVGVLSQNYDDARFKTVTVPTVGADLTWRSGPNTRITGEIERSIDETTTAGASGYVTTSAGGRIRHSVAQNMSLAAYFFITHYDYRGVTREEFLTETGVSLRYRITPRLYVDADYDFRQRLSDVAGAEFDEHRFFIGLGTELDPTYTPRADGGVSVDSTEFYLGAQVGDSYLQTKVDGPRGGGGNLVADFGDSGATGGLFAGYRAMFDSLVLGVEVDANFGSAEWSHTANRTFSVKTGNSVGLSGIAGYRTQSGNLFYGRLGASSTEFESRYQRGAQQVSTNDRVTGFNVGLGAEFPLGDGLSGRMEYQLSSFNDYQIGAPLGGDNDNFANVQGSVRFGLVYVLGAQETAAVEPTDFSGFYAGGQLGHGSFQSDNSRQATPPATGLDLDASRSGQGYAAGVLAGYGYQSGSFYIGAEADLALSSANWNIERSPVGRVYSVEKVASLGASVRVGYVLRDSVLLYGRAGLVRSKFNTNYEFAGSSFDQSNYVSGVRIGGGVEFALNKNVHVRLDYTHTNFDTHSLNYGLGSDQFDTSENLFQVGITYQF